MVQMQHFTTDETTMLKTYYESFIDRLHIHVARALDLNWYSSQIFFIQLQYQRIIESILRTTYTLDSMSSLYMFLKVLTIYAIQVDASFAFEQMTRCISILENEQDFNSIIENVYHFLHYTLQLMFRVSYNDLLIQIDASKMNHTQWSLMDRAIFRFLDASFVVDTEVQNETYV